MSSRGSCGLLTRQFKVPSWETPLQNSGVIACELRPEYGQQHRQEELKTICQNLRHMQLDAVLYWFLVHSSVANLITWDRYAAILHPLKPHLHGRKFLARLGWKKYAYQKNWFGTDRFSRVNDFGPSVPDQNFTRARTMSRGSPSTDKTGTRSWKSSPARIKCAV